MVPILILNKFRIFLMSLGNWIKAYEHTSFCSPILLGLGWHNQPPLHP